MQSASVTRLIPPAHTPTGSVPPAARPRLGSKPLRSEIISRLARCLPLRDPRPLAVPPHHSFPLLLLPKAISVLFGILFLTNDRCRAVTVAPHPQRHSNVLCMAAGPGGSAAGAEGSCTSPSPRTKSFLNKFPEKESRNTDREVLFLFGPKVSIQQQTLAHAGHSSPAPQGKASREGLGKGPTPPRSAQTKAAQRFVPAAQSIRSRGRCEVALSLTVPLPSGGTSLCRRMRRG